MVKGINNPSIFGLDNEIKWHTWLSTISTFISFELQHLLKISTYFTSIEVKLDIILDVTRCIFVMLV